MITFDWLVLCFCDRNDVHLSLAFARWAGPDLF